MERERYSDYLKIIKEMELDHVDIQIHSKGHQNPMCESTDMIEECVELLKKYADLSKSPRSLFNSVEYEYSSNIISNPEYFDEVLRVLKINIESEKQIEHILISFPYIKRKNM